MSDTEDSRASTASEEESSIAPRVDIVNFAIDEVWRDNPHTEDVKILANEVLDQLVYYFKIMKKMENSDTFMQNVINRAAEIQEECGGRYESALAQALRPYKSYIEKEIISEIQSTDESEGMTSEEPESDESIEKSVMESDESTEKSVMESDEDDDAKSEWSSIRPVHSNDPRLPN